MIAIGIDGGGTKTDIALVDTKAKRIMKAHTVASNLNIVSDDELQILLKDGLTKLGVNHHLQQPIYCFGGFAGAGSTKNQQRAQHSLERLLPADSVISIEPDAVNGLFAGTMYTDSPGVGIVQISGTGSITLGRDAQGVIVRVGGYGHLFDDLGSGYSIGHQAIQAVLQAYDGRQPPTLLLQCACKHYEVDSEPGLIHLVTSGTLTKQQIASFAPYVFDLQSQDQAATDIIERTKDDIIHAITTCVKRLTIPHEPIPLVLTGGLFQHQPEFFTHVSENIKQVLPQTVIQSSQRSPVYGALFGACLSSKTHTVEEWQFLFREWEGVLK